jgi:hypothetical protein
MSVLHAPRFWNPHRPAALGCGLLAVLLAPLLSRALSERPPHTGAADLAEFAEQLRQRGVELHAIPAGRDQQAGPGYHVYLTEDPAATWLSMQAKARSVECLHEWRGTVCVEHPVPGVTVEEGQADWGGSGRRIGKFLLFGDERLLRRIEQACR